MFPVKDDGALGEAAAFVQHSGASVGPRQKSPQAHMVQLSAGNRFVLVSDLGLDQVITYRLNPAQGTLIAEALPLRSHQESARAIWRFTRTARSTI